MHSRRQDAGRRRRAVNTFELERRVEGLEYLLASQGLASREVPLPAISPELCRRSQQVEAEAAGVTPAVMS